MALSSQSDWKEHPLVTAFHQMQLVSRKILEDGDGVLFMVEVRQHHSGTRQKLTYRLDTHE